MKKILSLFLVLSFVFLAFSVSAFAEPENEGIDVYVTISNKGELVVSAEKISVTDIDNDNTLTLNDVLYCAHEAKMEGGASQGFASAQSDYGLSLTKLWGDESGNFGYYINNASPYNLEAAVEDGDSVVAFVYKNGDFSDKYSFFDQVQLSAKTQEDITLTLKYAGFDADWNTVYNPLANAAIIIGDEVTEYKTDTDGKVTFQLDNPGTFVISAKSDTDTLVPPACVVTAKAATPESIHAIVTISNKGELVLSSESILVTDIDNDDALTLNDVLYCAHEAKMEGGAAQGYGSAQSDYGLSLTKLWGDESGNFGYYLNNASPYSLAAAVEDGDSVVAFIYKNADYSDKYSFFDNTQMTVDADGVVTLTLRCAGFDADWNTVYSPVANATILINGEETSYKTDEDGKVQITLGNAGTYVISAKSDTDTLVPPSCKLTAEKSEADTNQPAENKKNNTATVWIIVGLCVLLVVCVGGYFVIRAKKTK